MPTMQIYAVPDGRRYLFEDIFKESWKHCEKWLLRINRLLIFPKNHK